MLIQTRAVAQPLRHSDMRSVEGRVRRPVMFDRDSIDMGPATNTWVTIHRVGKDSAGPVDSVRSDARGHYRLRWRAVGSADAVYFASVTWHGIAYFTPPLRERDTRGDAAEITVFDTTSKTFPLSVKGRHLIISGPDDANLRSVIEVFEIENDSLRTLVTSAATTATPTWSVRIPNAAQDVRVSAGEIAEEAFTFVSGRVNVYAPIAPGVKQVSFSYHLPSSAFPMTVANDRSAVVLEVLLEELLGSVQGAGSVAVDPVTMENRTFRRFLAQDVKAGASLVVQLSNGTVLPRKGILSALLLIIGSTMLVVLARALQPSHVTTQSTRLNEATRSERLAHEIAMLDAAHESGNVHADTSPLAHRDYASERAALKATLRDALAAESTQR